MMSKEEKEKAAYSCIGAGEKPLNHVVFIETKDGSQINSLRVVSSRVWSTYLIYAITYFTTAPSGT